MTITEILFWVCVGAVGIILLLMVAVAVLEFVFSKPQPGDWTGETENGADDDWYK